MSGSSALFLGILEKTMDRKLKINHICVDFTVG